MPKRFVIGVSVATISALLAVTAGVLATVTFGRFDWGGALPVVLLMVVIAIVGAALALASRKQLSHELLLKWVTVLIGVWGLGFGALLTIDGHNVSSSARRILQLDRTELESLEEEESTSEKDETDVEKKHDADSIRESSASVKKRVEESEAWLGAAVVERNTGLAVLFLGVIALCIRVVALRTKPQAGDSFTPETAVTD